MSKSLFRYITLLLMTSSLGFSQGEFPKGSDVCSMKKSKMQHLPAIQEAEANPVHSFDVLNYTLYLDIYNCFLSPYPKSFAANEIITFRTDSTINSISLNASSSSLVIDSVGMAGISFVHASNILTITLDNTYIPGDTASVKIYYRHNNITDNAFYASGGFVFTDCEPEGARSWRPCWDRPSDKATLDLTARVPSTAKLGSNGRLADSTTIADTTYFHWISKDPISTYLVVISARVGYNLDIVYWHKLSNPLDSIPMRFYWNAGENTANLNNIKTKIIPMTTYYSTLFGEHPFEKNGFATMNSQFTWGGMENQTLTSLCPNCWSENLVSHEFAHQWFGDMITCGTWADIWLNEGFATYCEALWYEYTGGYTSYKNDIISDANGYITSNPGWPIYNPSWATTTPPINTLFNTAIIYNKGACVLHMLRYTLGDSLFFAAINAYAADTTNFKYKNATTADFISKVNAITGQNLSWFFNQWVYQPNHPVYQNTYNINSIGGGNWLVGFKAKQTQSNPLFFTMPIELKFSFTTGPDTTIRVMNTFNSQIFEFAFDRQPTAVIFDPNTNIVLKQGTTSVGNTLTTPTLVSPVNGSIDQATPIDLFWNKATSAATYRLQISVDSLFGTVALDDSTIADTTYQSGSLAPNSTYYWRIASKNSGGTSAWSNAWKFETEHANIFQAQVSRLWNLVSLPLMVSDRAKTTVYPTATSSAYAFQGSNSYSETDTLTSGIGYWLKFSNDETVSFSGDWMTSTTIPVVEGWNLIGSISDSFAINQISSTPPGILNPIVYGYQGGYHPVTFLSPGSGYWIKSNDSGSMTLSSLVTSINYSNPLQDLLKERKTIMIRDAAANAQILYYSLRDDNVSFTLPPLPPAGIFDARFSSGLMIETAGERSTKSIPIIISSAEYPVTITWQQHSDISSTATLRIDGKEFPLNTSGSITIHTGSRIVLVLHAEAKSLPTEFALQQCYPNPFNPTTHITYSIPHELRVQVTVINTVGQLVATLVDELQQAGTRTVEWDASNIPAGMYFYKLHAGTFTDMKKMLLIK